MIDFQEDIRSLSDFKRNTTDFVEKMVTDGRPMVLTINGKAKLIVQDAAAYQKMLGDLDRAEAIEGIRRGLADVQAGRTQPVKESFQDIRRHLKTRTKTRKKASA